ncbi:MAG: 50S ribosomal protein L11 methyltransferase [bacterium]
MKHESWIQIGLSIPSSHHDLITGQLSSLGFGGFLQEEISLFCYIEQKRWTKTVEKSLKRLLDQFSAEFPEASTKISKKTIVMKNWNAEWEKSIGIIEATHRIIIKPSWKKLRKKDKGKIIIEIDPKMAFGTGHHETTRLSLTLLEEYIEKGMKVLDFGTGTGILAIAAAKLGASFVVAIDNDPWAIDNAKENVRKNKVSNSITLKTGDISKAGRTHFDLVIANIDLPTITKIFPQLLSTLKVGCDLILSGILETDLPQFVDFLSNQGAVPLEILNENEWIAIALTKADANLSD